MSQNGKGDLPRPTDPKHVQHCETVGHCWLRSTCARCGAPTPTHEELLKAAGAIDLRDNARIIRHDDGYVTIEPIDPTKRWGQP